MQERLGRERAGALVEQTLAAIARGLAQRGVRRFVVAGGETAGAVVQALGVTGLRIGRQIDPGVPWTMSLGDPPLALALKSGNFGAPDFFLRAFKVLAVDGPMTSSALLTMRSGTLSLVAGVGFEAQFIALFPRYVRAGLSARILGRSRCWLRGATR